MVQIPVAITGILPCVSSLHNARETSSSNFLGLQFQVHNFVALVSVAFCLLFGIAEHAAADHPFDFRTIAITDTDNQFGPGPELDGVLVGIQAANLANNGDVAFHASLRRAGQKDAAGLWLNQGGTNKAIALIGESGPLGPNLEPTLIFNGLLLVGPGDNGEIAFHGSLRGDGVTDDNWSVTGFHVNGINHVLARAGVEGGLGPAIPGAVFQYMKAPLLYPNGDFLLGSTLTGPAIDELNRIGIWKYSNGERHLLFRTGVTGPLGPGIGNESFFISDISSFPPQIASNAGDFVVAASVQKSSVSPLQFGLWRNTGGANVPFMLSGDDGQLGPGLGDEISFSLETVAFPPGLKYDTNSNSEVLFSADLNDGRSGFWQNQGDKNSAIALTGETGALGPGIGTSVTFTDLTSNFLAVPTINDNGVSVFKGTLEDTNQIGLWINDGETNRAIALTGQSDEFGPDLGPDTVFSGFNGVVINNNNSVFFTANISPGVPRNRNLGLWAYKEGEIIKLASVGEMFDIDPTELVDERVIRWVSIPYGQQVDSNGATTNDRDEVVVRMGFEDGTFGIFVAKLVPEPAAMSLALGAFVCSFVLRQRNRTLSLGRWN